MSIFGSGPAHTNGTRVPHEPAALQKAEAPTGKASGSHLGPPLPAWMEDTRRNCAGKPTMWWYAPQHETIEERDEDGNLVFDEDGKVLIADRIALSTEEDAARAVGLCATCPLNLDCREYGLRYEPCGIWGGVRIDHLKIGQRRDLLAKVEREKRRRRAS